MRVVAFRSASTLAHRSIIRRRLFTTRFRPMVTIRRPLSRMDTARHRDMATVVITKRMRVTNGLNIRDGVITTMTMTIKGKSPKLRQSMLDDMTIRKVPTNQCSGQPCLPGLVQTR